MTTWVKLVPVEDIPKMGSRKIVVGETEIAIFKTKDGSIFAINNVCPHKQGNLSEGLVHEHIVTCPLHNWDVDLATGEALGNDTGCTNIYETKIEENLIYLKM